MGVFVVDIGLAETADSVMVVSEISTPTNLVVKGIKSPLGPDGQIIPARIRGQQFGHWNEGKFGPSFNKEGTVSHDSMCHLGKRGLCKVNVCKNAIIVETIRS